MPELPEVEITRRHLDQAMTGRILVDVVVSHERTARLNASPTEVATRLKGRTVGSVRRHGKFLIGGLDAGVVMLSHLGMSGRFSVTSPDEPRPLHTHVVMSLDTGEEVRFIDPRTFGFVAVFDEEDLSRSPLVRLGPDAWERPPTVTDVATSFQGRTASIKALLLDQGPIAGLGNIYADEVLYRARIHPLAPGGQVDSESIDRLLASMREVLSDAIDHGGTTLDDLVYLLPDGRAGDNLSRLAVYGRDGLPCLACGTPIERVVVRTRSTHFCPSCQVWPRGVVSLER